MTRKKKAFITGINGQDGSYLAEYLLAKDYEVYGIVRRTSSLNRERIAPLLLSDRKIDVVYGDITDALVINRILNKVQPDEFYNLAAQSHVGISFELPDYTAQVTGFSVGSILESIKQNSPRTRFYQASSSELFGKVFETPQKETTPFNPQSPYACAKAYAFSMTKLYREAYGLFACNGILFNHESPRRGENFVTRKITMGLAKIKAGIETTISLGNLNALRDWGYAPDFVECMWRMLQTDTPSDYVVATGVQKSVREFAELAARHCGFKLVWKGEGVTEKGYDEATNRELIRVDPKYYRPAEVDTLLGDSCKAREELGWNPQTTSFEKLVETMIKSDLAKFAVNR